MLIPEPCIASQHPKHWGASQSQQMESSNKFHWKLRWITTHSALQQQGSLILGELSYQCDVDGVESETLLS